MKKVQNATQIRTLKLWEMLKQESDEEHPLTTKDIIEKLAESDISVDRRTLYKDIETLNDVGYEILTSKGDYQVNQYYVLDRTFDISELGILIDAIQSASFITEKKTKELTKKIGALAGTRQSEVFKTVKVDFNTTKHSNEEIYYNIYNIQLAIASKKQISFKYFDTDTKGEKVYRKNGEEYVASPVATVMNDNNYYFYAYHKNHDNVATYRVDRMVKVQVVNKAIDKEALDYKDQVSKNRKQAFGMFTGRPETVTFEIDNGLVNMVYDKFGEKVIFEGEGSRSIFTEKVMISDLFFGWCCSYKSKLKILKPQRVVDEFKAYLANIVNSYED